MPAFPRRGRPPHSPDCRQRTRSLAVERPVGAGRCGRFQDRASKLQAGRKERRPRSGDRSQTSFPGWASAPDCCWRDRLGGTAGSDGLTAPRLLDRAALASPRSRAGSLREKVRGQILSLLRVRKRARRFSPFRSASPLAKKATSARIVRLPSGHPSRHPNDGQHQPRPALRPCPEVK